MADAIKTEQDKAGQAEKQWQGRLGEVQADWQSKLAEGQAQWAQDRAAAEQAWREAKGQAEQQWKQQLDSIQHAHRCLDFISSLWTPQLQVRVLFLRQTDQSLQLYAGSC